MRPLKLRKPNASQLRVVHRLLQEPLRRWQRRRAETLLLFAAGHHATDIARLLEVHVNTTYADLHAFARAGVTSLRQERRVGAPPRLTLAHRRTIWRLADRAPTDFGLPGGRWTLTTLRTYLLRQRLVPAISREHLRRVLKKGASTCAGSGVSCSGTTPSGRPSAAASASSGGTAHAAGSSSSSMSSRSRSKRMGDDATRGSAAWCWPETKRPGDAFTCSPFMK
jgi:transposase